MTFEGTEQQLQIDMVDTIDLMTTAVQSIGIDKAPRVILIRYQDIWGNVSWDNKST